MTAKVWIPPNDVGYPPGVTSAAVALWIEDLRQAILEVGLVQTADTGQFNAATFTTTDPGTNGNGANAMADVDTYMVFRFNDALQATHPIFIRISIIRATGTSATGHTLHRAYTSVRLPTAPETSQVLPVTPTPRAARPPINYHSAEPNLGRLIPRQKGFSG